MKCNQCGYEAKTNSDGVCEACTTKTSKASYRELIIRRAQIRQETMDVINNIKRFLPTLFKKLKESLNRAPEINEMVKEVVRETKANYNLVQEAVLDFFKQLHKNPALASRKIANQQTDLSLLQNLSDEISRMSPSEETSNMIRRYEQMVSDYRKKYNVHNDIGIKASYRLKISSAPHPMFESDEELTEKEKEKAEMREQAEVQRQKDEGMGAEAYRNLIYKKGLNERDDYFQGPTVEDKNRIGDNALKQRESEDQKMKNIEHDFNLLENLRIAIGKFQHESKTKSFPYDLHVELVGVTQSIKSEQNKWIKRYPKLRAEGQIDINPEYVEAIED